MRTYGTTKPKPESGTMKKAILGLAAAIFLVSPEAVNAYTITANLTKTDNGSVTTNQGAGGSPTTGYNYAGYLYWGSVTSAGGTSGVGQPNFSDLSSGFKSFCIQFSQHVGIGANSTFTPIYDVASAPLPGGGMGLDRAIALGRLFDMHYSASLSVADASAFQLAVWEIVYDGLAGNAGLNLAAGNFQVTSGSTGYATAASWLADVGNNSKVYADKYNVIALTSLTLQDQVTGTPGSGTPIDPNVIVPEPTSMALFAIGGFGVAAYRLRRRKGALTPASI